MCLCVCVCVRRECSTIVVALIDFVLISYNDWFLPVTVVSGIANSTAPCRDSCRLTKQYVIVSALLL